ncbi:equilibrative nucleoside transporter 1-like, partial [Oppia nitens]|uniref:equilibrative nucleoside transporter 1-like n=1 Tax=Oppia nitens TaxID=1686743 RepID=UPI0023D9D481
FVYIILLINGIGTLLPWNMLINADSYFVDYKLKVNLTDYESAHDLDNYRSNFLSYLGIASISPNVCLQFLNLFTNKSYGSLTTRISSALLLQALVFLFTIVLAVMDTNGWPIGFFWLTMTSAVVINSGTGILQSCNFGLAAKLPMKYTNAVVMGTNLSGTIVSIFMIVSIALSPTPRIVGIIYFSLALIIIIICFISQFYLKNNNFYIHYNRNINKSQEISNDNNITLDSIEGLDITSRNTTKAITTGKNLSGLRLYCHVLGRIWPQLINIYITYTLTLTIFPALMADIKPINQLIDGNYFVPTFCFFFFNVSVTLGNYLAQKLETPGPKYLWIYCCARILFVPYFLLCNYRPENVDRHLPVLLASDWYYLIGTVVMSMSFGYLSSLAMMYAPRGVIDRHQETAGIMSGLALILGIFTGVNSSLVHHLIIS